ncbi:MAG: type I-E CRISPR-associated protein Cas6/Cse3/CasE [Holophaga sp.]|nr:type I-E CRISPR-associated protein Cas6/Cse3/CasE [Holophaga sp.]
MTWLARVELDTDDLERLRFNDSYAWHQRLWDCFPGDPEHARDFLCRVDVLDGAIRAWLLSDREPICPEWCPKGAFFARPIAPSFLSHRRYAFDVRVNPTKALVQRKADGSPRLRPNGKRASGKRIPLVDQQELRAWIDRKGTQEGFCISDIKPLEIGPMAEVHFRKKGTAGYHGGVRFRGVLEVTDSVKFAETYRKGIGSAKAFGFGLLLLAPLHD